MREVTDKDGCWSGWDPESLFNPLHHMLHALEKQPETRPAPSRTSPVVPSGQPVAERYSAPTQILPEGKGLPCRLVSHSWPWDALGKLFQRLGTLSNVGLSSPSICAQLFVTDLPQYSKSHLYLRFMALVESVSDFSLAD